MLVAEAMGRTPEFVFLDKASIYIVRDLLDKRQCDVVMGLDTGDPRVLTTRPYYRTGYVFVQRNDSPLDIESWDSPDLQKVSKVALSRVLRSKRWSARSGSTRTTSTI